jgi:indoleacetamide hydrolase
MTSHFDSTAAAQFLARAPASKHLNAFIHVGSATASISTSPSQPLRGWPLVVKDNIDVAGMPTTAGSRALQNHVPPRSASAIARLQQAGAVVLGKTNLHEFCFGITSNNAAFGPVRNPYALDRIAGGSSGGTACAIAAGLAPAGIGSDTGGSMRIPAALCGVVGFRPTTGRWPSDGVVKISDIRDTLGPMAHSVADCALLDAVVCNEALELTAASLKGVRIGVPRRGFWQPLEASMEAAAEAALVRLAAAGAVLVECDVGIDDDACNQAGMVIAFTETFECLENYLKQHGLQFDPVAITAEVASPDVRGIFNMLLEARGASTVKARGASTETARTSYDLAVQVQRPALQKTYADCFAKNQIEALIFPTTPLPAALIGEDDTVMFCGAATPTFPIFTRNVGPGSVAGLPGISVPMGCNAAGLPLGLALDGPAGSDRRLLAISMALQALMPAMPKPLAST